MSPPLGPGRALWPCPGFHAEVRLCSFQARLSETGNSHFLSLRTLALGALRQLCFHSGHMKVCMLLQPSPPRAQQRASPAVTHGNSMQDSKGKLPSWAQSPHRSLRDDNTELLHFGFDCYTAVVTVASGNPDEQGHGSQRWGSYQRERRQQDLVSAIRGLTGHVV